MDDCDQRTHMAPMRPASSNKNKGRLEGLSGWSGTIKGLSRSSLMTHRPITMPFLVSACIAGH